MSEVVKSQQRRSPRVLVATMISIVSALVFFALLLADGPALRERNWAELPLGLVLRYALAMGLGGAAAGVFLTGLFGRRGVPGWILALLAGVVATLLAGVLGSAAGLAPDLLVDGWQTKDMVPILAGLLILPLSLVDYPWLGFIWLALICLTHLLARSRRG